MPHIWCSQMHAGGYPACGCRSIHEDLSSWKAYGREPVGSLSVPYLQGNGLGAFALVVLLVPGPLGRRGWVPSQIFSSGDGMNYT